MQKHIDGGAIVLPDPGEGPNETTRNNGFFEFWAHGTDGENQLRVKVAGQRDPGYGATSRMLAQAGLCLARDDLSVGGGIWTTASALGDPRSRKFTPSLFSRVASECR